MLYEVITISAALCVWLFPKVIFLTAFAILIVGGLAALAVGARLFVEGATRLAEIVITSYSIHYTKLYERRDSKSRSAPGKWNCIILKTLFLNPPSFDGFDGGAGARYQAKREIRSFWYPTWLAQPAAMVADSRLIVV